MRRRPMLFPRPVGKGVSRGPKTWFLLLLGCVALPLLLAAPISADSSPTASYTITGISGTNSWYRGNAGGNYVVLHWTVLDPGGVIVSMAASIVKPRERPVESQGSILRC